MRNNIVGVALLGRWHLHAEIYAKQAKKNPNTEIICVWDPDPEVAEKWAEELETEWEKDLDVLLARTDVDVVAPTNPTTQHFQVMVKAARAGKHILCEKVPTVTMKEFTELKKAVIRSGVKFVLATPYKTEPIFLFAKHVCETNWLGEVTSLHFRVAHDGVVRDYLPAGFYAPEEAAGGAMIDLGPHITSTVTWLLDSKPVSILSAMNSFSKKPVDDNAICIVEYENNILATMEVSFVSFPKVRELEISGTKGTLRISSPMEPLSSLPTVVKIYRRDPETGLEGWLNVEDLPKERPCPFDQLIDCIINNGKEEYDIDTAENMVLMCEGAYVSGRKNKRIYFSELEKESLQLDSERM